MEKVFGHQSNRHLHKTFYVSNMEDIDEVFEKLQYEIYEAAQNMNIWGNSFPLKWILLEHLIEINKNEGNNFIRIIDMFMLAKHPDINILRQDDLLLFLQFQHNVGNIIFFEDIPDLIILKPQWLADAFRCLFSYSFNNRLVCREDWILFITRGELSDSLITELFKSKAGGQFSGQKKYLLKVMEKLDIIVKLKEAENNYIMPSEMPTSTSTVDILCERFGIFTEKTKRTSWLCLKFKFLPPYLFDHVSALFIRNYMPCRVSDGIAYYRGFCLFDYSDCEKILVTASTDTIALQVVSFSEQRQELGSICSNIFREVTLLIDDVKKRHRAEILYKLHFKCCDGYFFRDTFEYEKLKREEDCYCLQHKLVHLSKQMYSLWMNEEECV